MPRGDQLIRQWRLLRAIESSRHGRTATQLHREVADLGSPRTVYRDLEVLQGAGFPLYRDDEGRWRLLEPSEGGPAIPVQPTEMIALLLSEQVLQPLSGSVLAEPLAHLRARLESMLNPMGRDYVDRLRERMLATVPAAGDYGSRNNDLQLIQQAIREYRRLQMVHFAAHRGKTLPRRVDPYGIWYVDGGLYLIAFDHLRADHRKFLVDRIRQVVLLEETFTPDPEFDIQAYVGSGFRVWHGTSEHVVIELDASIAHLPRERRYHRTQKVFPLPDGRCRVTFTTAGLPELAAWIASFGGKVRVAEPQGLVDMVRSLHRHGLEAHTEQRAEGAMSGEDVSLDDRGT